MFPSACGDQRVDLALEEAGLTPVPAESTLPVGCLEHTRGGCLRDESPVAWDEMDSLLSSLLELLLRWLQAAGRLERAGQSIRWDTSLLDPHANKCPKIIHRND